MGFKTGFDMKSFYILLLRCIYVFAFFEENSGDGPLFQNSSIPVNNLKFTVSSLNDSEHDKGQTSNMDIIKNGLSSIQSHIYTKFTLPSESVIPTIYASAFSLDDTESNLTNNSSEININDKTIIRENGTLDFFSLINDINSTDTYLLNDTHEFKGSSKLISGNESYENVTSEIKNIFSMVTVDSNITQTAILDDEIQKGEFLHIQNCPVYVPKLLTHKIDVVFSVLKSDLKVYKLLNMFELKLRQALQEKNCYFVIPLSLSHGAHFIYSWTNSSLNNTCDTSIIKRKMFNESDLSSTFKETFLPYFNIESVVISKAGLCATHSDNVTAITVVLIAVIVISAFCAFGIYRCIMQKKNKLENIQKRILRPRFPVILDSERSSPSYALKKLESSYHIANLSFQEET